MLFWHQLWKIFGVHDNSRGIEVNPNQIKATNDLHPPRNPKEVQKLTGMTTTLNRFISRSADQCRPFSSSFTNEETLNGPRNV